MPSAAGAAAGPPGATEPGAALASAAELGKVGFRIVIFPGGIVRAIAHTAQDYYRSLHANGTNEPFRNRMLDFDGINRLIGTADMLALGKRYETEAPPATKTSGSR